MIDKYLIFIIYSVLFNISRNTNTMSSANTKTFHVVCDENGDNSIVSPVTAAFVGYLSDCGVKYVDCTITLTGWVRIFLLEHPDVLDQLTADLAFTYGTTLVAFSQEEEAKYAGIGAARGEGNQVIINRLVVDATDYVGEEETIVINRQDTDVISIVDVGGSSSQSLAYPDITVTVGAKSDNTPENRNAFTCFLVRIGVRMSDDGVNTAVFMSAIQYLSPQAGPINNVTKDGSRHWMSFCHRDADAQLRVMGINVNFISGPRKEYDLKFDPGQGYSAEHPDATVLMVSSGNIQVFVNGMKKTGVPHDGRALYDVVKTVARY